MIRWLVAFLFASTAALAQVTDYARYPNCRGWINFTCCCTNEGCREVQEGELEQIGADEYRVVMTGEIVKRTDWSKDGSFIRCASEWSTEQNRWLIGPQYKTRCLYVPLPAS